MTSLVVQVQCCDTKLRISLPIMQQCYWHLQGCCILQNIPDGTHFDVAMATCSVPVSCLFKMKCCHLRLNKAKYLVFFKMCASPTFIKSPLYHFICPVQLQMVIFDFKEEETGTEHVAIATSKCEPSGIFHRVQQPCQVSIALLHWWRYSNFVSRGNGNGKFI